MKRKCNMKRLFYLLMMLSCTLWSCSKSGSIDDPDDPDNPGIPTDVTLDISASDLVFEAKGGEKEFTVYCNSDWTVTNGSEWCKTNVTQGNGNGKIIVTAGVYSEMEDRNTNLTVKAGDITKILTATQKSGDAIILSKDKFDIPEEGGNVTVEVKSNIQYEVSIPSQFQDWIKREPESKSVTVKNFTFTILENKEYKKREGYIVFSGNSLKDTVRVYQTADPRELILSGDTFNISSAKQSIEVELKSNVDYDILIPDSVSHWIKQQLQTKALRTDMIRFDIEENTTYDNRSAQVIVKDKNSDLSDTLYINQLQQNALILSQKRYEVPAGGGQISIEVQSNTEYEVIIPDTVQGWVKQAPQTKALTNSIINLEISPNTTYDNRSAQIIVKDKNSTLSDTLYINQQPNVYLNTSPSYVKVSKEGGTFSIVVTSNVDYDVIVPDSVQSWLSMTSAAKSITSNEITFKVSLNDTYDNRDALIIFKDRGSVLSDTVFVRQVFPIEIPDPVFRKYLLDNFDSDHDGSLSRKEAKSVYVMEVHTDSVESLAGIEFFPNLERLTVAPRHDRMNGAGVGDGTDFDTGDWRDSGCFLDGEHVYGKISSIDLSGNPNLRYFECHGNTNITTLDFTGLSKLETINSWGCLNLETVIFPEQNSLIEVSFYATSIESLDVSFLHDLEFLTVSHGKGITSLDVTRNSKLKRLVIGKHRLSSVDVSCNPELEDLECCISNLESIDVSRNPKLLKLSVEFNRIKSLDLLNNPNIQELRVYNNCLSSIDLTVFPKLENVHCGNFRVSPFDDFGVNTITALDLSGNPNLVTVDASLLDLRDIDFSCNTALTEIYVDFTLLSILDVSMCPDLNKLSCYANPYLTTIVKTMSQHFECFKDDHTEFKLIDANVINHRPKTSSYVSRVKSGSKYSEHRTESGAILIKVNE